MKKSWLYPAIILTGAGIVFGCKAKKEETAPDAGKAPAPAMAARVNGSVINTSEVTRETNNLVMQMGGRITPQQLDQFRPQLQRQALDNLINQRLLLQAVIREGIQLDDAAVDEKIASIKSNLPEPEKLTERLAAAGISQEAWRRNIKQTLEIQALLDRNTPPLAEVSDQEVETYYQNNPQNFETPERIRASHILIGFSPDDSPEKREEKRLQLSNLRGEIEQGADFEQLARAHSTCPSKERGGDLSYFSRGQMVKPFEDAAFSLESGVVSDIVETQFGYHLIKVTDRKDARVIPLEESREQIAEFLKNQQKQQDIIAYLQKLRETATIEYAEGFRPPTPPEPPE